MTEVASAYVSLLPSARGFGNSLTSQVGAETKGAGSKLGGLFGKAFGAAVGIGVGFAVTSFIKKSVGLEASFSQTMNTLGAVAKVPEKQLAKLSELAIKMGADTVFSATEASDAMLELAKGGLTAATIRSGALQGTLTLAAAGGTDMATAATIASNALNTFSLKGKDMGKVAAALAGGANASTASIESLGEALSQVGPGAANAGLSFQETVAALSAFDAAGIKGSDAGTSLKTMLTRLVPQTKRQMLAMDGLGISFTNANGSFKDLTEVAQILQDKLGGLSDEQRAQALSTLFGSDATRAATVLMNEGAKGIQKYIAATQDQDAAQSVAAARMKGTAGALEQLRGSIETASIRFGMMLAPAVQATAATLSEKALPALMTFLAQMQAGEGAGGKFAAVMLAIGSVLASIISGLGSFVGLLNQHRSATIAATTALIALVAVTKLHAAVMVVQAAGGMLKYLQATKLVTTATKTYTAVQWLLNAALSANPIGLVIIGLAALATGLVVAYKKSETFRNVVDGALRLVGKAFEWLKEKATDAIDFVVGIPGDIKAAFSGAKDWLVGIGKDIIQGLIDGITAKLGDLKSKLSSVTDLIPDWKGPLSRDRVLLKPTGAAIMDGLIDGIDSRQGALRKKLDDTTKAILDKLKSRLSSLKSDMASLADSVASAFTSDVFGGDLRDLLGGLGQDVFNLTAVRGALDTLRTMGASKEFLSALFQSGNADLILSLTRNPGAFEAAQRNFALRQSLAQELGAEVGWNQFGDRIDKVKDEITKLRGDVQQQGRQFAAALNSVSARVSRNSGGRPLVVA